MRDTRIISGLLIIMIAMHKGVPADSTVVDSLTSMVYDVVMVSLGSSLKMLGHKNWLGNIVLQTVWKLNHMLALLLGDISVDSVL